MKRWIWFGLVPGLLFATTKEVKESKDPIANLVNDEFKKEATSVKTEWEKTTRRVDQIQTQRVSAADDSKRRGQWESEGSELIQKFQTVMASRYHNANGEFDGGLEVAARDVDNINKVLHRYLSTTPLKGKVSAGEAMRFLEWGTKRLNSLAKTHLEPSEQNNSDLEILAYQLRSAQRDQAKLMEIAKTVGFEVSGTPPANNARKAPAKVTAVPPAPAIIPPVGESLFPQQVGEVAEETPEESKFVRVPSSNAKKKQKSLLPDF